jgi:hypothetical protein
MGERDPETSTKDAGKESRTTNKEETISETTNKDAGK